MLMKYLYTLLSFLLLGGGLFARQPLNRYIDANRIYLDSRHGLGGECDWRMMKAGDVDEQAEKYPGQPTMIHDGFLPLCRERYLILLFTMAYIRNPIMG